MKHLCIALVAVMAASFSAGRVAAQYEYGPEEEGAEESPIPDPDVVPDDSEAELEEIEAMDGKEVDPAAAKAASERKRHGCEVDPPSATSSPGPIMALLFGIGLVVFRRMRHRPRAS